MLILTAHLPTNSISETTPFEFRNTSSNSISLEVTMSSSKTTTSATDNPNNLSPPSPSIDEPVVEVLFKSSKEGDEALLLVGGIVLILAFVLAVYLVCKKLLPCIKNRTRVENLEQQQQNNHHGFTTVSSKFNKVCTAGNFVARHAFKIATSDFEKPLGQGRIGIVYQASTKQENDDRPPKAIAVKKVEWSEEGGEEYTIRSFLRELKIFQTILKSGGNENIVEFLGACCSQDGLFLLMELCETSLEKHLRDILRPQIFKDKPPLLAYANGLNGYLYTDNQDKIQWLENIPVTRDDFLQLILWCEQIACGMKHLHENGIIHLDLSVRNVLLKGGIAKICDFGHSLEHFGQSMVSTEFSFSTFAPEFIGNHNASEIMTTHVDVWAYGCILWGIFTLGGRLYEDVISNGQFKFMEVSTLLQQGYRHPKPPLATDDVYKIILKCWENVPGNRPNATYLHAFFKSRRTGENYFDFL